jgi:hypothetical protein
LINQIEHTHDNNKQITLIFKAISNKELKINNIISNLTQEERIRFNNEYADQICWLQMS